MTVGVMTEHDFRQEVARELGEVNQRLKGIDRHNKEREQWLENKFREKKEKIESLESELRPLQDWKLKVETKVTLIASLVSGVVAGVVAIAGLIINVFL